ncbi:hypothetical protein Taro_010892 [Colocasia esculenta]|uniref:Uncharacterized protein n=1 Tax=Colocasia esculenta TaxID=4460 RepID=A0A843U8Q8_COLES|nr:hypothetical protein [Colocasia esculenta]
MCLPPRPFDVPPNIFSSSSHGVLLGTDRQRVLLTLEEKVPYEMKLVDLGDIASVDLQCGHFWVLQIVDRGEVSSALPGPEFTFVCIPLLTAREGSRYFVVDTTSVKGVLGLTLKYRFAVKQNPEVSCNYREEAED